MNHPTRNAAKTRNTTSTANDLSKYEVFPIYLRLIWCAYRLVSSLEKLSVHICIGTASALIYRSLLFHALTQYRDVSILSWYLSILIYFYNRWLKWSICSLFFMYMWISYNQWNSQKCLRCFCSWYWCYRLYVKFSDGRLLVESLIKVKIRVIVLHTYVRIPVRYRCE